MMSCFLLVSHDWVQSFRRNALKPINQRINRLNKVKIHAKVVDFIEEKVHEKHGKHAELEYLLKRLSDLKQSDI